MSTSTVAYFCMEYGLDAKLTIYPVSGNGKRVSYTGCCVQSVSDQYEAEGEARRDLKLFAVERVEE